MATNLRLTPELEAALRLEAERSKRSQQEVIRAAIERYLGLDDGSESSLEATKRAYRQKVIPPRTPFRSSDDLLVLPEGMTSLELMQRGDRL